MTRPRWSLVLALLVASTAVLHTGVRAASATASEFEIHSDSSIPRVGQVTQLRIVDVSQRAGSPVGLILRGTSRPGSVAAEPIEHRQRVVDGSLSWTPQRAGLVRWIAVDESDEIVAVLDLAVAPERVPPAGLLILLAAGTTLFGGIAIALRRDRHESS
ncbi:MAG: hypothetical protein MPN21_04980 [Thermoanaerobaculia bacterium]|nr:hypothetical protein [Thermoanaerobaculia bacterium]